jgi:hypothetical protein
MTPWSVLHVAQAAPLGDKAVAPPRRDLYAHLLLSVLPWAAGGLAHDWPEGPPELLAKAGQHVRTRVAVARGLTHHSGGGDGGGRDLLEVALEAAEALGEADGTAAHDLRAIPRPWRRLREQISHGTRHAVPVVAVPDPLPAAAAKAKAKGGAAVVHFHPVLWQPELGLELGEDLVPVEAFVMNEYLRDSLVTFRPFVTEKGFARGSFKSEVEQLLALAHAMPPSAPLPALAADALLTFALQLPGRDPAYLQRLMLAWATHAPDGAKAALVGRVEALVARGLLGLDVLAARQLADVLGVVMTTTGFEWPFWAGWAERLAGAEEEGEGDANPDPDPVLRAKQTLFVRRVLDVAARISYVNMVKTAVGPGLAALVPGMPHAQSELLPAEASEEPQEGDSRDTARVKELLRHLRAVLAGGMDVEDARRWLEGQEGMDPRRQAVILMHALSRVIEHTASHLPSLIEKCLTWFRALAEEDDMQVLLVATLAGLWRSCPLMLLLSLNALMRAHVVLPLNVVAWVLQEGGDAAEAWAHDPLYWEVLSEAVERSLESVEDYRQVKDNTTLLELIN